MKRSPDMVCSPDTENVQNLPPAVDRYIKPTSTRGATPSRRNALVKSPTMALYTRRHLQNPCPPLAVAPAPRSQTIAEAHSDRSSAHVPYASDGTSKPPLNAETMHKVPYTAVHVRRSVVVSRG